jgi:hypothetical protein
MYTPNECILLLGLKKQTVIVLFCMPVRWPQGEAGRGRIDWSCMGVDGAREMLEREQARCGCWSHLTRKPHVVGLDVDVDTVSRRTALNDRSAWRRVRDGEDVGESQISLRRRGRCEAQFELSRAGGKAGNAGNAALSS